MPAKVDSNSISFAIKGLQSELIRIILECWRDAPKMAE